MKYSIVLKGVPPPDLAQRIAEAHASAILSRPRDRDGLKSQMPQPASPGAAGESSLKKVGPQRPVNAEGPEPTTFISTE